MPLSRETRQLRATLKLAAVITLLHVAVGARAQNVDSRAACAGMSAVDATILDANRCAQANGWEIARFWTQISDWYETGGLAEAMRIMCGPPAYVRVDGSRRAVWQTRTIYRFHLSGVGDAATYGYSVERGPLASDLVERAAAGNAVCGSLHLPEAPQERD
jgi:hypothetical protein